MQGALCIGCASRLACADYHVPGIVRSTVPAERAVAWLIDPWGQPHALTSGATLGRAAGNDVVISDRHVSSEHAELKDLGDGWRVRDRGSSSGTHVGGQRNVRNATITHLGELQIASIGFYLWARPEPPAAASPTVLTKTGAPAAFRIVGPAGEALTVRAKPGRDPQKLDGTLVFSTGGERSQQPLSVLQFQFLRMLCERAIGAPPSGGYVDTRELLFGLPFPSPSPQEVNVRQVVRGVRKVLETARVGLDPATNRTVVIEAATRLGYRLAWRVEYAADDKL